MSATVSAVIEPLIERRLFNTEEEAIRELVREYLLGQIAALRQQVARFAHQYGMHFQQFTEYLHERSVLLESGSLSLERRQVLGQAIMQEEDDWLDWKIAQEMLAS